MQSFKHYLENYKKKYVPLYFTKETNKKLLKYAQKNGFDLTKDYNQSEQKPEDFTFHLTVFYTSSAHDIVNRKFSVSKSILKPTKIELLGENKDIPVLKIEPSEELLRIKKLFEDQGFESKWEEFKPHITLSYNWNGQPDINTIPLPDFKIVTDYVEIKDQS